MHVSGSSIDLKRYDVSPERGFLPEVDPERALPAPLALWQELASELPKRLAARRVRAAVRGLPRFELAALRSAAEERAAMRVLSFLGHAFVWEGEAPDPVLPAVLAVPWCAVARKLGREVEVHTVGVDWSAEVVRVAHESNYDLIILPLSAEPPLVLLCIHADSDTHRALSQTSHFGVSALSRSQAALSRRFASKAPDRYRVDDVPRFFGPSGALFLKGSAAHIEAETVSTTAGGDHTIFIGKVVWAQADPRLAPLVYHQGDHHGLASLGDESDLVRDRLTG